MIITIDGSAGSGKSTAARELAARLGLPYLDTGAMYRALAVAALRSGVSMDDDEALARVASTVTMQVTCEPEATRVQLDGEDVTGLLRTLEVSRAVSRVATVSAIRSILVNRQREIGRRLGSLVTEGRDQGSVVFPNADVKFLIVADATTRARRRHEELLREGQDVAFADVLENVRSRDAVDEKQWAPLVATGETVRLDTTGMAIAQVVDLLVDRARRAGA
jgi:cytidylate kinase